jgi:hypothetical protein
MPGANRFSKFLKSNFFKALPIAGFLFLQHATEAQAILKPSIGVESLPADSTPICYIPVYIDPDMTFESPGLHIGDTVPDFKLFTVEGDSVVLSKVLSDGKPVLLVGGSYTCPLYRNHVDDLNDIVTLFGDQIHTYVIYTVEAHPQAPEKSPYSGTVWNPNQNTKDNIFYSEPVYYKDRKDLASIMIANTKVSAETLLDGPCNLWWETFAYAPNPAFLIKPDGTIYEKQGWFNGDGKTPMADVITSLLNELNVPYIEPSLKVSVTVNGDNINFNTNNLLSGSVYSITNSIGQACVVGNVSNAQWSVSTQDLSSGIYLYQIINASQRITGKIYVP